MRPVPIHALMEPRVPTVSANDYAESALLVMWRYGVTQAFVVERNALVGVVYWHDLQRDVQTVRMDRDVREYMRANVPVLEPQVTADDAWRVMQSRGVDSLPVVQGHRLLGMVTRRALRQGQRQHGASDTRWGPPSEGVERRA